MPQQVDNGTFYEYRRDHKFRGEIAAVRECGEKLPSSATALLLACQIIEDIGAILQGMAEHHPHEPHCICP